MNHKKQLLLNTIIIAVGKLSTQVISFLLLPLYTSKLTPAEYGTYDFLVTLSIFLLPIITLLMEESMFRFLIDVDPGNEEKKKKIIMATVAYSILGSLAFTVIAAIVMLILKYEYAIVFILFIISNVLIGLSNALTRGIGKIKLYSVSNFLLGAFTIILNVIFILVFKLGTSGLLWANTIANTITALVVLFISGFHKYLGREYYNRGILKTMIRYSIPLVPNNLSWIIISLSDRVMLMGLSGADSNGIYSMANKFPNIIYTFYGFFSTAWKESAARILKEENKVDYYNGIYKDIKKFLKAVMLGLIAVMPLVFSIFIKEAYQEAYIYIPILVVSIYYTNMSNFYGGIFAAYKNTKIMGYTTTWAAIINVVINLIFIPRFGIYAASFSTLIANIAVYYYRRVRLKRYIKLDERINFVPWILLTCVIVIYYLNNSLLHLISFIVVAIYSVYSNREFLLRVANHFVNKGKKSEIEEIIEDDNNNENKVQIDE